MQRRSSPFLGALALLLGFLMVCLGAFLISSGSLLSYGENTILSYCLLPLGFLILLSGIFWSTYQQARASKGMFTHVLGRPLALRTASIPATVDRPDFYPPAYGESLDSEKQACPGQEVAPAGPPPLYAEQSLELEDESHASSEAPPSYEESVGGRTMQAVMWPVDTERQS